MPHSTRTFATIALMLATSISAWAQTPPTEAPGKSGLLQQLQQQSCWHPGLSRNIGIAEPGCDAPRLDRGTRPESKSDVDRKPSVSPAPAGPAARPSIGAQHAPSGAAKDRAWPLP
jgi:hypothetical protein